MRLSKRVWGLWGIRILATNILLYSIADYFKDTFQGTLLLLFADSVLVIMLTIKYKSTMITINKNRLCITQGLFLRRSVFIKLNSTCATRSISTPLCQKLSLCYLIIYCEGVKFLLPPLDHNIASYIEKECRKR